MKKERDKKLFIKKLPLKKIIRDDAISDVLNDTVYRINDLTTFSYLFLKSYILKKYEKNESIPIITSDLLHMIFKTLGSTNIGPKPKGENKIIFDELNKFYLDHFEELFSRHKITFNCKNLSSFIDYQVIEMMVAIENNIKLHFFKYIKRYIKSFRRFEWRYIRRIIWKRKN